MTNDLQENEDRKAAANIEALLSRDSQAALIEAARKQYMLYAPTLLLGEKPAPRLQQLWRVCLEFTLGLPSKLNSYWHQAAITLHPIKLEANYRSLVLFLLLLMPVMVIALPLALFNFFRAYLLALWNSVVTRHMIFLPMGEYVARLKGE